MNDEQKTPDSLGVSLIPQNSSTSSHTAWKLKAVRGGEIKKKAQAQDKPKTEVGRNVAAVFFYLNL